MSFDKHCATRAHCRACRTEPEWRAKVGAPDDCPHGITLDNIPNRNNTMNIIRDTSAVPDDGWQYPSLTGPALHTRNYSLLYGIVRAHYQANGAPVPSEQDVIDYLCRETPVLPCYDSETRVPLISKVLPAISSRGRSCCGK